MPDEQTWYAFNGEVIETADTRKLRSGDTEIEFTAADTRRVDGQFEVRHGAVAKSMTNPPERSAGAVVFCPSRTYCVPPFLFKCGTFKVIGACGPLPCWNC